MGRRGWLALCIFVGGCGATTSNNNVLHECVDFSQDGSESDVDCGGTCGACAGGRRCIQNDDCASDVCSATGRCLDTAVQSVAVSNVLQVVIGASSNIGSGTQTGYGITASDSTHFRLVWSYGTSSIQHYFYGTVYSAGTINSAIPGCQNTCSFGADDYLSLPYSITGGQAVDFEALAPQTLEGFDLSIDDAADGTSAQPLYFDLYVDGEHHPELVFFPSAGTTSGVDSPSAMPFGLTTTSS